MASPPRFRSQGHAFRISWMPEGRGAAHERAPRGSRKAPGVLVIGPDGGPPVPQGGGPFLPGAEPGAADVMGGGLLCIAAGFGMFKPGPAAACAAAREARPAMARARAIEQAAIEAAGAA